MTEANQQALGKGNRTCPECGTVFSCAVAAGESQCWCFNLPRIISLDESDDRGCLCPACLGAWIARKTDEQAT
ncbi:MAG: cysteine-rich CWC family protein [Anaerolineae bacterium]|nr:cysteine-rich CWC family protein [Anaerolineae bacterium]